MGGHKEAKTSGIVLRIVLSANLIAMMSYGAVTPHEMSKVTGECVTIGIAGLAMAVQIYVTLSRYMPLPYAIWAVIALDTICATGWVVAIALLSYWDREIVYSPRTGDPIEWFQCAEAKGWDKVLTSDGVGHWIHLVWCKVEVDGQSRLLGNEAARQQLHVLIGLSAVSLLFTGLMAFWVVRRGKYLGLLNARK